MEWQPIETAPKDGTAILMRVDEFSEAMIGRWISPSDFDNDDCFVDPDQVDWFMADFIQGFRLFGTPSGWMPLPAVKP